MTKRLTEFKKHLDVQMTELFQKGPGANEVS